jgi:chromosome segregation ATPase
VPDPAGTYGSAPGDLITGTELVLAIDRGIRFFPGTTASIEHGMVSGLATISIPSLGNPGGDAKPLRPGDAFTLLPREDPLGKLLERGEKEDRLKELTDAFHESKAIWKATRSDAESLIDEVEQTWPEVTKRGTAVFDRFEATGGRLETLFDEIDRLRGDLVAIDRESEPLVESISRDLAEISQSSARSGERIDAAFGRTRSAFDREIERLASGLHAIGLRLDSLRLTANWNDLLADFSLAGAELGRALGDLVGLAARALGGDREADRMQARIDDLGRDLLAAVEQAREAEANLRAAVDSGMVAAETLPAISEALARIGVLLEAADRIERAYRELRIEAIPARPDP